METLPKSPLNGLERLEIKSFLNKKGVYIPIREPETEECDINVLMLMSNGINEAYDTFCGGNPPYHNRGCLHGSIGIYTVDSAKGLKRNINRVLCEEIDLEQAISHARLVGGYFLDRWSRSSWRRHFGDIKNNYTANLIKRFGVFVPSSHLA